MSDDQRVIWKFDLGSDMESIITISEGAEIVAFDLQDDRPTLWAIVDPQASRVQRRFRIVGTGWSFEPSVTHRGTVQTRGGMVWHLLELP